MPEIRDPNPPPALAPIRENHAPSSSDDVPFKMADVRKPLSGPKSTVYTADPGKSLTSLRTADTEQIERMAGDMDVVQRLRTRSQRTTGSIGSSLSIDTQGTTYDGTGRVVPISSSESPPKDDSSDTPAPPAFLSSTPAWQKPLTEHSVPSDETPMPETRSPFFGPTNPTAKTSVATRVHMYERRLSQDQELLSLTNTRQLEERSPKKNRISVDYGFVRRPNLFVANPDHRNSRSSDS